MTDCDKLTNLSQNRVNYGRKKFYDKCPRHKNCIFAVCAVKLFTAVISHTLAGVCVDLWHFRPSLTFDG